MYLFYLTISLSKVPEVGTYTKWKAGLYTDNIQTDIFILFLYYFGCQHISLGTNEDISQKYTN